MAKNDDAFYNDLFSSLISDIKSYSGKDPLLPWLRGIKKMKESLPGQVLNEKLPRFLQKCAQAFESDRRYRNDLRYLRVWLQLMDFVDDPKALLRTMEANRIGTEKSLFYQAHALYYEKMKKYEEAERMYRLGVQNLAEPLDELQKSYEQFLYRMEKHKMKKIQRQEGRITRRPLSGKGLPLEMKENSENFSRVDSRYGGEKDKGSVSGDRNLTNKIIGENSQSVITLREFNNVEVSTNSSNIKSKKKVMTGEEQQEPRMAGNDEKVLVKFVDTAIVGKSEAEDACHHGLVDPTINMKEAMNAINSMFREPIEIPIRRRSQRNQQKAENISGNGFEVFMDENLEPLHEKEKGQCGGNQTRRTSQEPFEIFIDDEKSDEMIDRNDENVMADQNAFVFLRPKDHASEDEPEKDCPSRAKFREDTVVHRFVGSTISDEPEVENVCHHGLVDPTINLKEAMDDINNMFGKPIDFVRSRRSKRQEKTPVRQEDFVEFSILPDEDDSENQQSQPDQRAPLKSSEHDLFEQTLCTKEAMDDINKMFGMPLDF